MAQHSTSTADQENCHLITRRYVTLIPTRTINEKLYF